MKPDDESWLQRWRNWIEETHSTGFELRRHFFRRFFDSELVSTPGQMQVVFIGALGIVASLGLILAQAYYSKYRKLLEIDAPVYYNLAALADHLFCICLSMVLTGLITALQWPSLFPGLRDYLALAGLPVRPRQIFVAKFTALFVFVGLFIMAITSLPSIILPAVMAGRYQPSGIARLMGLFTSTTLAGLFVFLCLVALQGILLNLSPARQFPRISLFAQGTLFMVLLSVLPFVFSIPSLYRSMDQRPDFIWWLPPFWFLGIDQSILGNRESIVGPLARQAFVAFGIAVLAAIGAYLWSYRRHRVRVLESLVQPQSESRVFGRIGARVADRTMPDPRVRGVFAFIGAALSRSRQHRMVLTAFVAIAGAIVVESFLSLILERGNRIFAVKSFALRHAAVSAPLALSLFALAGFRYLFRLPVELRANWLFQINEGETRDGYMNAVERFLVCWGIAPVFLLTLPIEIRVLGVPAGIAASALCLLLALVLQELLMSQIRHIPFTSAYMPGKRPLVETVMLYVLSAAVYVSILGSITVACVAEPALTLIEFGLLLALWARLRKARSEDKQIGKLEFEERPEPVVRTLSIERD